ncbi:hypothetical protein [Citrobacter sp. Res13-Sevr-PEB04-36]|uniref:hypothetical protein n=1 Tax=Citrobacter sp. Res13-Sevr-PEB04-36 TaxID=2777960 RepID=UPI0018ACC169|nr:hypothetical protein [Citrobacter sp. Res13-Sevr-PEB04-36]
MSKKALKKRKPVVAAKVQETVIQTKTFDYEDMLTELEAIVADAEVRLEEEDAA